MTTDELRALLLGLAELPYGGEPVDQLAHALQAAGHALADGADDELVLAALLHDAGRAEAVEGRYPGAGHDVAGERFAGALLGERVGWLVGQHAEAKRYLVATDSSYGSLLSPRDLPGRGPASAEGASSGGQPPTARAVVAGPSAPSRCRPDPLD